MDGVRYRRCGGRTGVREIVDRGNIMGRVLHASRRAAVVTAVAALAVLSACSSSNKSSSATTAAPTTAAPTTAAGAPASTNAGAASTSPATSTSTPAGTSVDSCTVVNQTQAGAALGQAVKPPVRGKATVEGGVACVFYGPNALPNADADVPSPDSVRVVLVTGSDGPKFFDDYRSKVAAQSISGLGDQAYWDGLASVSVLKGTSYVRIAIVGVRDPETAEKTLAAAALARM